MIYIVSGFMRSGTSAMMQAVEAGGMQVHKSIVRDGLNAKHSDDKYKPNPVSLYEPSMTEIKHIGWPRQYDGYVIKVVAPFIRSLSVHEYRVVWMKRDIEEIRQSYQGAFSIALTSDIIQKTIDEAKKDFLNRKDVKSFIEIEYAKFVENPDIALAYLNWPINIKEASKVVNKELYRFRLERLTIGI